MQTIPLEPVDGLTVTTLVENAGRTTRVLVPCHCTGWRAIHAIAARFPEAFIQNGVGTRFELTCADS